MRFILGRAHHRTIVTSGNLAVSLGREGKHTKAVEIEREVLAHKTRLLGAERKDTLTSATNLASLLWQCGRKVESEQIIRETLALFRRALGPTHPRTQLLLQLMRAHDLTAR